MDNENIHICIKLDLFLKKIKMVQNVIFQDIKHQAATRMKGKKNPASGKLLHNCSF